MTDDTSLEMPYTVVVGVSVTSKSPTALVWAKAQALANHGRLVAVRAYRSPVPMATPSGQSAGRFDREADVEQETRAGLATDVVATLGDDHGAELVVERGSKLKVLLRAAAGADLLVVDAPRSFTVGPMFAHRLIYAATCPVVVMPPSISGEPPTPLEHAGQMIGETTVFAAGTAGRPGYRPPPHRGD